MDKFWQTISAKHLVESPALQIYQTNCLAARLQALEYNFPLCKAVLGDSLFTAVTKHYANSFPSGSDSLNDYGHHFPAFLSEIIPHNPTLQNTGYIDQMAELDWLLTQAYFAKDDDVNMINTVNDTVTEKTYIAPSFSLGLCQINHPNLIKSDSLQSLMKEGFGESETLYTSLKLEIDNMHSSINQPVSTQNEATQNQPNPLHIAIVRYNLTIFVHLLSRDEYSLLQLIRERTPIFKLDELGLDSKRFSESLTAFKQKGLIIGLKDVIDDTLQ